MNMSNPIATTLILSVIGIAMNSGCGAALPSYYDQLNYQTQANVSTNSGQATTKGFYVTSRAKLKTAARAADLYTAGRSETLAYGVCDVHVPRIHNIGSDVVTEQLSRAFERSQPGHFQVHSTTELGSGADFKDFFIQ